MAGASYHVPFTRNVNEGPTQDHPSVLGDLYFAILPRPTGCFTLTYRNKMIFVAITATQYTKASPESVLTVL